ncbi:MAG: VOC family protein [Chloroflexi bacterium]|nr:VOC family protein [Chloroflexota bacterium]
MQNLIFNFVGLVVSDWPAAYAFVHNQLGIVAKSNPEYGDWAVLGGGWEPYYQEHSRGAICELFDGGRRVSKRQWGVNQGIRPGFHVPDVSAAQDELRARGIANVGTITDRQWGRSIEVDTVEGIRIGLAEIPGRPFSADLNVPYIGHVAIRCADFTAMRTFYSDILGFSLMAGGDDYAVLGQPDGHPLVILEPGGLPSGFDPRGTQWADDPVRAFPVFLSLMTSDVHGEAARLQPLDVTVYRGVVSHTDWNGTDLHIADPDGNALQIVQYAVV